MTQVEHRPPSAATAPPAAPHGSASDTPAAPRAHRSLGRAIDGILGNPLVGLSPWILYSLIEGPGRLELSAGLAAALACVIVSLAWIRGGRPHMLEYTDVAYFAVLAVVVALSGPDLHRWLELWGGEVANVALLVFALGSILARHPFTLSYAKDDVPPEEWADPEFLRVNYLLSWVWVVAFGIEAASGLVGDAVLHNSNNLWTGWIVQTLPLIIAAQFTIWYPNRLDALREGRIDGAPTVRDFLGTVTPWVTITGIISLSADIAPEWVGITLLVAGIVLTKMFTSSDDAADARQPRRS